MSDCSYKCGGVCCQDFVISAPPESLGRRYAESMARIIAFEDVPYDWQVVFVCEMVIRIDEPDESEPRYTCKHFRADVGLCGAYEQRPDMCRRYPYMRPCFHCGYNSAPAGDAGETLVQISPKEQPDERAA